MARKAVGVKTSSDPAAGSELLYVADEDMVVMSARITFVTSAVVANRFPAFVADDGNAVNEFFRVADATGRAASTTTQYALFAGAPTSGLSAGFGLPAMGLKLRKGDRLRTITSALDVGDNYSAMVLQVERMPEAFRQSQDFLDA
jgi:hypothetical protein